MRPSRRPAGKRFRNLYICRGEVWYERRVRGRRYRFSTGTTDWRQAVRFRELFEDRCGITTRARPEAVPTLAAFAAKYLDEDTGHLAATTRYDRRRYLRPDGPILRLLGDRLLDEITPVTLRDWWARDVEAEGRSVGTGRHHLNTIAALYAYARDLGLVDERQDPVPAFRAQLRRRSRTKRGRAQAAAGRAVRPIEDPGELARLVDAARDVGPEGLVLVLLQLDAGLRLGEALGLRWGSISWGADEDPTRHLVVRETRSRGGAPEAPKSGRERTVALSRRLRRALRRLHVARGQPGGHVAVFPGADPSNLRKRVWQPVLDRAEIGHRAMKDLRDTFASQLLTAGVQLGYVSAQLGHADLQTTTRHYAKWCGGDAYRPPLQLAPGEVPADLLARLDSPRTPHTLKTASR